MARKEEHHGSIARGMTHKDADQNLKDAKAALAAAKARRASRQEIKDLQMKVSNAQAVRNLW